jgi:hypothetical protein
VSESSVGKTQFRAAEASGEVEQVASMLAEALHSQSPPGRLHSEAVRCMVMLGRKSKTEIPVKDFLSGCVSSLS